MVRGHGRITTPAREVLRSEAEGAYSKGTSAYLTGLAKCSACGSIGHTKANIRLCPKHPRHSPNFRSHHRKKGKSAGLAQMCRFFTAAAATTTTTTTTDDAATSPF